MASTGGTRAPSRKGRAQHKRSRAGRKRRDAPRNYWTARGPRLEFGDEEFSFVALRTGRPRLLLDHLVEGVTWDDSSAIMSGTMTVRRRLWDLARPIAMDFGEGDTVVCKYRNVQGRGRMRELWRMHVTETTDQASGGTRELTLANELARVQRTRFDYAYRKGKRHPRGWRAHEIARDALRVAHVRSGPLLRGTHFVKKLVEPNSSPLEVLMKAYQAERHATGRRFVVSAPRGRVQVRPVRRPRYMLRLRETLIDATVTRAQHPNAAAMATVRATTGKKKKRKLRATVTTRRTKRLGWVHRFIDVGHVDSLAEARTIARRKLLDAFKPKREVTFSHPGVPQCKRGDAILLYLDAEGIKREVCFVKAVSHNLQPGAYDMEVTVTFSDPYIDKAAERSKRKREAKAKARRRAQAKRATAGRPRAATARQRTDSKRTPPPRTRGAQPLGRSR